MCIMKRVSIICLVIQILMSFPGCAPIFPSAPQTPAPPNDCAEQTYQLSDSASNLKLLGRTYADEDGIVCDHTASGIEFEAYVQGDIRLTVEANGDTYFTVYVDGQRVEERYQAKGQTEIVIDGWKEADNLAIHTFRIVKQTESSWSTARLISMEFYGKLMGAAPNKELYIEFLGDSLTCGYGNLWTKSSAHPSSEAGIALYEDGTLAYPYLTAETLKADASIISYSGIGVDLGWTNPDGNGLKMMDFYEMRSYSRDKETEFSFTGARVPDLVVINLGCNDTSLGSPERAFKAGIKELIQYIRNGYGAKIPIVWIYGMGDGTAGWVRTVFQEMGGENEALYLVQIKGDASGGNGHPSGRAHKVAAAQLSNYLRTIGFSSH